MRRAFIAFGITAFLVYCWASVVYQNRVAVPGYKLVEVDLLGGASRSGWDANPQARFQRLMELENRKYQLPEDAGGVIPPGRPLTSGDFAGFIARAPAGQPVKMKLRDASAIHGLLAHNYLLRDNIEVDAQPGVLPLYIGGRPLDKPMIDDLLRRGIATITVTGHGAPVNFQIGTSLMIAIIFLTLVAALKPVVWEPFLALLEKRRKELEMGAEAERQNQLEATRYEEESRRRHAELHREIQALRLRDQRETAQRAAEIVKAARNQEKEVKIAGLRDLGESAAAAGEDLNARVPELAEAVAKALTPGRSGSRRDRMTGEEN